MAKMPIKLHNETLQGTHTKFEWIGGKGSIGKGSSRKGPFRRVLERMEAREIISEILESIILQVAFSV